MAQTTMDHATTHSPRSWKPILWLLAIGLSIVFWLPTRFPPPPNLSDSYFFGFNNHLCLILFIALVLSFAFLVRILRLRLPAPTRSESSVHGALTGRLLAVTLSLAALLCAAISRLAYGLNGLNDGAYFLDRIHLILRGQTPYRDFEFIYGPGSLYGPIALGHLLHVSAEAGYYLMWSTGTVLGFYLLWLSVRWIELPQAGKRTTFLLVTTMMFFWIPAAVLNYYSLRYSLPFFALIGLCRLDRQSTPRARALVILAALTFAAALLALFPEEGLVYMLTVCLYLPIRRHAARRPYLADIFILAAAFILLCAIAAHSGAFATMQRFGGGSFNLPVYPGPVILFAFAAILLMTFYFASSQDSNRLQSNAAMATLYGIGMLPGALGRCDVIHIVGYLLPVLVCAMLLSSSWFPAWRLATTWFFLFVLAIPFLLGFKYGQPVLSKALLHHVYQDGRPHGPIGIAIDRTANRLATLAFGPERAAAKMTALRSSTSAKSLDPRAVFPVASPTVAVPFEYFPGKLGPYQAPEIDEGFFFGTLNIYTPADANRKLDELRRHPEEDLVVSNEGFDQCQLGSGNTQGMRLMLLIPWVPQPKHEFRVIVPYCAYLTQHYRFIVPPSPETFGYGLVRRIPDR